MNESSQLSALISDDPKFGLQLSRVVDLSDYARDVIEKHATWVQEAWYSGDLTRHIPRMELCAELATALAASDHDDEVQAILRCFRHRRLLACLWRDLNGQATLVETLSELTELAEILIDVTLASAAAKLQRTFGVARATDGTPQRLVVLGMGKLGGGELNFSSDIDLIFTYGHSGETDGPRRISNDEYFCKMAGLVTRWLNQRTADGFVYRVDLRLRPFGNAGRLALSFAAMEQYYQRDGQDWERYALIKARPVAGDIVAGDQLLTILRPFIYRRYLDYTAFSALREMKAMIRAEIARRSLDKDIKLGTGGIREIEFIAQAFQLIRGGRELRLRERRLLPTLQIIGQLGLLDTATTSTLRDAYLFMRRLENRLQQVADRQTHVLPESPKIQSRIARALGRASWVRLTDELNEHRQRVARCFQDVFESAQTIEVRDNLWHQVWDCAQNPDDIARLLANGPFQQIEVAARILSEFRNGTSYRGLGERARARLNKFMPCLLDTIAKYPRPDSALPHTMHVVSAVATRSTYVVLMSEQPAVLARLVSLCGASPWIAERVAAQPLLLDGLIDERLFERLPQRAAIQSAIADGLANAEDQEAEHAVLRQIQQSQALAIAAAAIDRRLDASQVAKHLSILAETILDAVIALAWRDLSDRHGQPGEGAGLAIIGYGTLGGCELNYTSDLDLVFLHNSLPNVRTDGDKVLRNETFFARLSQRILNMLTALLPSGRLYRVDVRLRPNGNSGFLVSSLAAFAEYQHKHAWTWELQALSRARWVAGDQAIAQPFATIRKEILGQARDQAALAHEIASMRRKMRTELDTSTAATFDLKQGYGGKVDIEFLTQFARLAWGAQYPTLREPTGTAATLKQLGTLGVLSAHDAQTLSDIYGIWQRQGQRLALLRQPATLKASVYVKRRRQIGDIWQRLMNEPS